LMNSHFLTEQSMIWTLKLYQLVLKGKTTGKKGSGIPTPCCPTPSTSGSYSRWHVAFWKGS
jgi:hypothetical protein